jgi:PTS system nitrogen regulatory IIA component
VISVTLEKLRKAFGSTVAVDGVTLEAPPGGLTFLVGPSGCGKTTILRMIAGFIEPTAGVIRCLEPIPFDAPDGLPVRLLVFLLVPEQSTEQHLTLLSELAELMSDATIRESLMTLDDPIQVHHLLSAWEPQHPAA